MLYDGKLGEMAFVSLFCALCLVSLVIYGFPRLKQLDLRNLKLTLEKIESARKEIYAKEQDLKRLSLLLTESVLMNSLWLDRAGGGEEVNRLNSQWFSQQAKRVLTALRSTKTETEQLLRYVRLFERLEASAPDSPERQSVWEEFVTTIRKEVDERSQEQNGG